MNIFLNFIFSETGQPWKFFGGLLFLIVICVFIAVIIDIFFRYLPKIIHGDKKITYINTVDFDKKMKEEKNGKK